MVKSVIAKTRQQALQALHDRPHAIVAGGTDMLIQNRSHTGMAIGYKKSVLYINLIESLNYIRDDENHIYIGANTRLETILRSNKTPAILKKIIYEMASPAIRYTATLAGNIANASPAGDSLLALYAMDALVEIQSVKQTRKLLVSDFIQGVRKIDLSSDEMITEIIIPKEQFTCVSFKKVAPRQSDAISKLSFAGLARVKNGIIEDIRIALGAVFITVVRHREIEEKYLGSTIDAIKDQADNILKDFDPYIKPIDDQRSNRHYRKQVALNLIKDFIIQL
ncbi:MAG TPA: FAD binding domain-containing protein [Candidatus Izemoplasmatales bacterium]|nr:FAD binding domain-containing protein [Candidatus Izemoplasmatales bacterium]